MPESRDALPDRRTAGLCPNCRSAGTPEDLPPSDALNCPACGTVHWPSSRLVPVSLHFDVAAERDRLRAENERLRAAGERLWQRLADGGCGHSEPRAPQRKGCLWCASTAQAMDGWDRAIDRSRPSDEQEAT